jgi:hypothetical protein
MLPLSTEASKVRLRVKTLIENFNLVNLVLIAGGLLFGFFVVLPMFDVNVTITQPRVKETVVAEKPANQEQTPEDAKTPGEPKTPVVSPFEYTIIAEQNIFHPERRIPPEKKEEKPLPKPDFVLYGTLITDDARYAYMDDKKATRTTPGRGKRQTALKVGDSLSGFVVKEVDPEQVVMVRGEEKVVVKVIDPTISKDRVAEGGAAQVQQPPQAQAPQGQQRQPVQTRPVRQPRRAMPTAQPAPQPGG